MVYPMLTESGCENDICRSSVKMVTVTPYAPVGETNQC
jgi:hypothetical protein